MPKFKRGGAGTPAIMSEPDAVTAPIADPAGVKGARATAASTAPQPAAAVPVEGDGDGKAKPRKPRNPNAAPKKDV